MTAYGHSKIGAFVVTVVTRYFSQKCTLIQKKDVKRCEVTDRLKAWCHWKRKENHVSEDTLLMVRDIEALLAENAKLRDVVEAAKELVQEHYIDATCKNCTGETNHVEQLLENLERLETTNG